MKANLSPKAASALRDKINFDGITKLRDLYKCKGRIKAEGKKAKPSFCFRARTEGTGSIKTTVLELHSKVTGKQIGFFGGRTKPFVKTREEAEKWDYLNGSFAPDQFRWFLNDANQKPGSVFSTDKKMQRGANAWNKAARDGLREMTREAKKK